MKGLDTRHHIDKFIFVMAEPTMSIREGSTQREQVRLGGIEPCERASGGSIDFRDEKLREVAVADEIAQRHPFKDVEDLCIIESERDIEGAKLQV
ncbi:MAG: hypothetical protein ABS54_11645 [Hyphomicrobium sp. SCN 65-11]|nr:MAG: hypothetical protein ABS54_11645 [Hyphomicrobium sp. SCN 65-11]